MFVSACFCVPVYLRFNSSFSLPSEYFVLTPVLLFVEYSPSFRDVSYGSGEFSNGRRVIFTSLSDQHWRSCMISV